MIYLLLFFSIQVKIENLKKLCSSTSISTVYGDSIFLNDVVLACSQYGNPSPSQMQ